MTPAYVWFALFMALLIEQNVGIDPMTNDQNNQSPNEFTAPLVATIDRHIEEAARGIVSHGRVYRSEKYRAQADTCPTWKGRAAFMAAHLEAVEQSRADLANLKQTRDILTTWTLFRPDSEADDLDTLISQQSEPAPAAV